MKNSTTYSNLAAVLFACAAGCAFAADSKPSAPAAADAKALLPDPAHRAIFCGDEGTETSAAYSQALAKAIRVQLDQGSATSVPKAIERLQAALCIKAKK